MCTTSSSSVLLNLFSCTSPFIGCAGLTSCCVFCGLVTYATLFFLTHNGHSLHLCPFSPHLKHSTSTTPTLLIMLSSTSHCITLLFNTSNLFWGMTVPSSSLLLFLQFWARYLNFLQLLHSFFFLSSSSSLSLARAHFSLSRLLNNELYYCRDMMLCLYRRYGFNVDSC